MWSGQWPGPELAGSGRAWASNMTIVLRTGPGLAWTYFLRAGPGPHNSVCGSGPGQVCTTAAGPGRAWASNHIAGPGPTFQARAGPYCTVWTAMQDILHGFLKDTNFFSCSSSPDTTIFCRAQTVQTTCLSSFSPISANFHISVMCLIVLASLYRVATG